MPVVLNYTGLRTTNALADALDTSSAAYAAAAANTYVEITETEFNRLENLAGAQGFGLKRTATQYTDRTTIGTSGYTSQMFLPNQALVGLVPYAFMTKLEVGADQRVQLATQVNTVGATMQVAWIADSIVVNPATTSARHKYFIIKDPTRVLPANTNISVDGFFNGWGAISGGNGIENAAGSYSSTSANDTNRMSLGSGTVTTASTGTPSAAYWTNYRILMAPKQW